MLLQLQRVWTLFQRLPATKEDEKKRKISGILGKVQEDILEGNEGKQLEAGGFCSRGDNPFSQVTMLFTLKT